MYRSITFFFACFSLWAVPALSIADGNITVAQSDKSDSTITSFRPFTGKTTGDKVRLRVNPDLDSPIIKELNSGDLLNITQESGDFFAVKPPVGTKTYIFRTYILDGLIEGTNINVRLAPDTEAPIIAQLNTGDNVEGIVSPINSKWLEIAPPKSAHFYVSKDYIEYAGDSDFIAKVERRRRDVSEALNSAYLISQSELRKPFEEINFDLIKKNFDTITKEYQDFPDQAQKASEALSHTQEAYLNKKISYLETKSSDSPDTWKTNNANLNEKLQTYEKQISTLQKQQNTSKNSETVTASKITTDKMEIWEPIEADIFRRWQIADEENADRTLEEFYAEQSLESKVISGILEPYTTLVKNKPGDYIIRHDNVPIAYLYSTKANLQDSIGEHVTIVAILRDNNNFAFPAYFALSIR